MRLDRSRAPRCWWLEGILPVQRWSGAGSNRRPSAFQEAAFLQAGGPDRPEHAIRVRHQCLATIDLGSLAGSPRAARSDSAAAISASRPATACRYRYDAAGEACPSLPLRRRVGTVAVDAPLAIRPRCVNIVLLADSSSKGSLMGLLDTLKGLVGRRKGQADEGVDKFANRAKQEADGTSPRLSDVDSEEESEIDIEEDSRP